jgi:glycosyltransferase involved in cell wall biosynthesis
MTVKSNGTSPNDDYRQLQNEDISVDIQNKLELENRALRDMNERLALRLADSEFACIKIQKALQDLRVEKAVIAQETTFFQSLLKLLPSPVKWVLRYIRRYADIHYLRSSGYFDVKWYLSENPDVAKIGLDPIRHYVFYGFIEGRNPHPGFNTSGYIANRSKTRRPRRNPFVEYLKWHKGGHLLIVTPVNIIDLDLASTEATPLSESELTANVNLDIDLNSGLTGETLKHLDHRCDPSILPELILACALLENQPLVSVVIPCFNYGDFVIEAIDSILCQTLKNVEVIVVDGGSTDTVTVEILREIKRPRTTVLFRDGRHLVGDNRNFAIEKAKGRYICCLDADDTVEPTYLEKSVFYLETYGYDIVSTAINFTGVKKGTIDILEYPDLTDMVNGNHVLTCAVFRRQLWELSGGYIDVGIGRHHIAEDWDFWLRLTAKGARIRNISGEYLFNYRIHDGGSLSSDIEVKSIADQKAAILHTNKELLTSEAFSGSSERKLKKLKCNPTQTALVQSNNTRSSKNNKTLLLAMPFCLVGGAERLLSALCSYLAGHGWRIIVITTLEQEASFGSSIDWFKKSTVEIFTLPQFLTPIERCDFIHYLIASRKPDCLLNTGSRLTYELLPSLKLLDKNLCVVDLLFNTVGHVDSHIEFKRFITFALAENEEVYNWYLNVVGWPANLVRTMTSGVDLDLLQPTARPKQLEEKYAITEAELVIGYSGRLSEEKAPDLFVEIAELCQEIPNLRFVMTGAGPMSEAIIKQIKSLPDKVRFDFAGLVEDVNQYLALYDILILPSKFDGRPLVVMEALASGVPVIASNVGALSDLIEDGVNGCLVPVADVGLFVEKIRMLKEDKALLKRLKSGARDSAEACLDANKAYRNYDIALREAIEVAINSNDNS